MNTEKLTPEQTLKKLKDHFIQRLRGSVEAIDNVVSQRQLHPLLKDDLERAQRLVHGLSGTGTTFGFPAVSEKAGEIDGFLTKIIEKLPAEQPLDESDFAIFEQMLLKLRQICIDGLDADAKTPRIPSLQVPKLQEKSRNAKSNILIVDDDELITEMVAMKLQTRGMYPIIARTGDEALNALTVTLPDLIILDIMMPGLSGHEVLRRIKQDPILVNIPVIMLTAQTQRQDVVTALHSGAIDYVIKPVDTDALAARVEKILDAGKYTVMIVDNDQLIIELLNSKYKDRGFRVLNANDGHKGWDMIYKNTPDIVILDKMLPGMGGLEILYKIRTTPSTKNIPVILLSAHGQKEDIEAGLKAGAQDYVKKPFLPDDLIATTIKLLKGISHKTMSLQDDA